MSTRGQTAMKRYELLSKRNTEKLPATKETVETLKFRIAEALDKLPAASEYYWSDPQETRYMIDRLREASVQLELLTKTLP